MSSLQIWLIFFHYHNGKVTATLFIWKILTDWCMLSHFSHIWFFVTLKNMAHQAPLSMGFSRQEYWSELPCSPPGHLPNPGIEPTSVISPALAGGFFTTSTTWIDLLNHCKLWVSICQSSNESFTVSQSLLKLMSLESVMLYNHLILCRPLLLPPSIFPSIRVFPVSHFFPLGGQSIRVSAPVLPMNTQD